MAQYEYLPLNPFENSFRLLIIKRGQWNDEISCQIFEAYQGQQGAPSYRALSYKWANPEQQRAHIFIDGHPFEISESLLSALRQIRQQIDQDFVIWIDAICINQNDVMERGHQVKQMGDIYESADEVLIWLGQSSEDIHCLFDSITWIDRQATEAQVNGSTKGWLTLCHEAMIERLGTHEIDAHDREKRALAELLRRPYFERVWILQEVGKAKMARVMCGVYSCPARAFALMPKLVGLGINEHTQAVLDIMPRLRKTTWWSSRRFLHYLIDKFANSKATDVRDKVYALLGISDDACDPRRFYPDYRKTKEQIFRDTVSFMIFGNILDESHSFPDFEFSELHSPLIQLAEKVLRWTLGCNEARDQTSAQNTARVLVSRLNEGTLKTVDLILSLAKTHDRVDDIHRILSLGDIVISVIFGDEGDVLRVYLKEEITEVVDLRFECNHPTHREVKDLEAEKNEAEKRQREERARTEFPSLPWSEDENMVEAMNRMVEAGSSKEELLRAGAWAGNLEVVERELQAGADVNGADDHGSTALHYAAWRGHLEIVLLLINGK